MATILFVILRLGGLINTSYDWVLLCFLIAIDTIGIPTIAQMIFKK